MIAITGISNTLVSAKKMHDETIKQAKSMGKELPKDLQKTYTKNIHTERFKTPNYCEPKLANRWLLKFPKKSKIVEWDIKALTRPTYPFNAGGKISVELRDFISTETNKNLLKFVENQKPFKLKIEILDPIGEVVEKWVLRDCIITDIKWSPLDYESKDISKIYVDILYCSVKIK